MAIGSVPSPGIKYIRVNRYDNNSVDIADNIRYARHIRVDHGTNVRQYNIISAIVDPNDSGVYYLEVQAPYTGQPSGGTGLEAALVPNVNFDVSYSEYNALYSNANDNQVSRTKYIVERDTFDGVPSNLTNILTGFEQLAEIQDDLYTDSGLAGSRFKGSRNTSTDINIHTQGDGAILQKPAVELTQEYFAYFEYIGGTSPEIPYRSSAKIKYLIGSDGTILDTSSDDICQYIMESNFQSGDTVVVQLDNSTFSGNNMESLNGEQTVFVSGKFGSPIIHNHAPAMPIDYASGSLNREKYGFLAAFTSKDHDRIDYITISSTWEADGSQWITGSNLVNELFTGTKIYDANYVQKGLGMLYDNNTDPLYEWYTSGELSEGSDYEVASGTSVVGTVIYNNTAGYGDSSLVYKFEPHDYITFQSQEYSNWRVTYQILEVVVDGGTVYLKLNRNVDPAHIYEGKFQVVRYTNDPKSLVLSTNKPPGGTSGGIIKPKYVSQEAEESIRKTISDMRQKGMI